MWKVGVFITQILVIFITLSRGRTPQYMDLGRRQKSTESLIESQQPDGSFLSRLWLNNADSVQTMAYALHALLDLESRNALTPVLLIHNLLMNKVVTRKRKPLERWFIFRANGNPKFTYFFTFCHTTALIAK
jgi:hypothetical protein